MKGAVRASGLRIVLFPQVALIRQSPLSGSAPNFYVGRFQAASRKSASVLLTLWRMGFHSAFWNSAATETGR